MKKFLVYLIISIPFFYKWNPADQQHSSFKLYWGASSTTAAPVLDKVIDVSNVSQLEGSVDVPAGTKQVCFALAAVGFLGESAKTTMNCKKIPGTPLSFTSVN